MAKQQPRSITIAEAEAEEKAYYERLRSGAFFVPHGGLTVSIGRGELIGSNASRTAIEDVLYPRPVGVNGGSGLIRPQRGI